MLAAISDSRLLAAVMKRFFIHSYAATAQGNLPEAQRLFGEALRIRQRLAESDPANAAWQRDL